MKLPFEFGLAFFFRILMPGLIWSAISYPFLKPFSKYIIPLEFHYIFNPDSIVIAVEAIISGILIFLMDSQIYKFYEGLRFWPEIIRNKVIKRLNEKIKEKYNKAMQDSSEDRRPWMEVGIYPQDENGFPTAVSPTQLGNVILGYERYSSSRYGMDATFYWPRIWLVIDKDTRNDLDNRGAYADMAVYSAFVFFILSLIYFTLIVSSFFRLINNPEWYYLLSVFILTLFSSYFFYRLAIAQHFQYGEFFKAVFDLYKDKVTLSKHGEIWLAQKEKYRRHTRLLRYNLIRCNSCDKLYFANYLNCPNCQKSI